MKCIECGRTLGVPYVMASGGPLGPKCARMLGVQRPRVPRGAGTMRGNSSWS